MTYTQAYFKGLFIDIKQVALACILFLWSPIKLILVNPLFFTDVRKAFSTWFGWKQASSFDLSLYDHLIFESMIKCKNSKKSFPEYFTDKYKEIIGTDDADALKTLLSEQDWRTVEEGIVLSRAFAKKVGEGFSSLANKSIRQVPKYYYANYSCAKKMSKLYKNKLWVEIHREENNDKKYRLCTTTTGGRGMYSIPLSQDKYDLLVKIAYRNHVSEPVHVKSFHNFLLDLIPAIFYIPIAVLYTAYRLFLGALAIALVLFNLAKMVGTLSVVLAITTVITPFRCGWELMYRQSKIDQYKEQLAYVEIFQLKQIKESLANSGFTEDQKEQALLSQHYSANLPIDKLRLAYLEFGGISPLIAKNPLYLIGYPVYMLVLTFVLAIFVMPFWKRSLGAKLYANFKNANGKTVDEIFDDFIKSLKETEGDKKGQKINPEKFDASGRSNYQHKGRSGNNSNTMAMKDDCFNSGVIPDSSL